MNPDLYVIKGAQNSGKTSTCWRLFQLLQPIVECYNYWETTLHNASIDQTRQLYTLSNGNAVDFVVIVTIKETNKKVAIISAGDNANPLKSRIYEMLAKGVKTIVCCERSYKKANSSNAMLANEFIGCAKIFPLKKFRDSAEELLIAQEIYNAIIQ